MLSTNGAVTSHATMHKTSLNARMLAEPADDDLDHERETETIDEGDKASDRCVFCDPSQPSLVYMKT